MVITCAVTSGNRTDGRGSAIDDDGGGVGGGGGE